MRWPRRSEASARELGELANLEQLHQTIVSQAIEIQRQKIQIELLQKVAKSLGVELEKVIAQPEGSDEHLAATWWRDQYAALTEQVQEHLKKHHPGAETL